MRLYGIAIILLVLLTSALTLWAQPDLVTPIPTFQLIVMDPLRKVVPVHREGDSTCHILAVLIRGGRTITLSSKDTLAGPWIGYHSDTVGVAAVQATNMRRFDDNGEWTHAMKGDTIYVRFWCDNGCGTDWYYYTVDPVFQQDVMFIPRMALRCWPVGMVGPWPAVPVGKPEPVD